MPRIKEKDFFETKKNMEIYCQHIYSIRNIKEMSLGRRIMIPDRILDLYKEMNSTGNRVNKIQIFLFLIALKDNNKKKELQHCIFLHLPFKRCDNIA